MILELNKHGKIVSVKNETDDKQDLSLLIGFNFVSLVANTDSQRVVQFLADIRQRDEPSSCNLRLMFEHGDSPEFACIGIPLGEDRLSIIARRVVSGPANVFAEQLSEAKQRIRLLFNKLPVSLLVVNRELAIEAVNPTSEKIFGYSRDEWRPLSLLDLVVPNSNRTGDQLLSQLSESPGRTIRLEGKKKSGATFPMEVSAEFMDGTQSKLLVCIFDISERFELENLRKQFVQTMSHDLRGPLTNLSLYLESIKLGYFRTRSQDKLENSAARNFDEVSRLIRMINRLLELDKLEHGFDETDLSESSVAELIGLSLGSVSAVAQNKGILFESDITDYTVTVDHDQIVQVLVNFLGNAVKFSPADSTIKVSVVILPSALEVRVEDQGPGIPADMRAVIFERFSQLKSKKAKEGSGLGLAICKAIVESHGGTVGVESEEGKGSVFWFRLPLTSSSQMSAT